MTLKDSSTLPDDVSISVAEVRADKHLLPMILPYAGKSRKWGAFPIKGRAGKSSLRSFAHREQDGCAVSFGHREQGGLISSN